jgi:hypothetical protein
MAARPPSSVADDSGVVEVSVVDVGGGIVGVYELPRGASWYHVMKAVKVDLAVPTSSQVYFPTQTDVTHVPYKPCMVMPSEDVTVLLVICDAKCKRCGAVGKMVRCPSCWECYCGRDCQVADWSEHKKLCDAS